MIPQEIFNYFAEQHDLLLTESEYADIIQVMGIDSLQKQEAIAFLMYDDTGDRTCRTLTKKDYENYYDKWKALNK
jgi:AAA+ ATPase superfamily predicted ATPase